MRATAQKKITNQQSKTQKQAKHGQDPRGGINWNFQKSQLPSQESQKSKPMMRPKPQAASRRAENFVDR